MKFSPLIERIAPKVLLQLLSALLCERRIIFTAKSASTLSDCIHAAVALLYPFQWQHIFIPLVPVSLLTYACAPMPFLMGVLDSQVPELDRLPLDSYVPC